MSSNQQVKDATRGVEWAAVPGAECMLLSNAGIFLRTAKSLTNSYGVAIIEDVQPGYYQVCTEYISYTGTLPASSPSFVNFSEGSPHNDSHKESRREYSSSILNSDMELT